MYHTALEKFVSDVSGAVRFCIVFEKTLIGAGGGFITVPVDANLFGISLEGFECCRTRIRSSIYRGYIPVYFSMISLNMTAVAPEWDLM